MEVGKRILSEAFGKFEWTSQWWDLFIIYKCVLVLVYLGDSPSTCSILNTSLHNGNSMQQLVDVPSLYIFYARHLKILPQSSLVMCVRTWDIIIPSSLSLRIYLPGVHRTLPPIWLPINVLEKFIKTNNTHMPILSLGANILNQVL